MKKQEQGAGKKGGDQGCASTAYKRKGGPNFGTIRYGLLPYKGGPGKSPNRPVRWDRTSPDRSHVTPQ